MKNKEYYYVNITNIPVNMEEIFSNINIDDKHIAGVKFTKTKGTIIKKLWKKKIQNEKETIVIPLIVEVIDEKEVRDMVTSKSFFIDKNEVNKTNFIRVKLEKQIRKQDVTKVLKSLKEEDIIKYTSIINQLKYEVSKEYDIDKKRRREEAKKELEAEEYIRKYKIKNWR